MHKFSHHNAQRLENADRYKLLQPKKTLARFGLKSGMAFVDIGAGTGFFSREAAEIVGDAGTVYALDMSREMLEILKQNGVRNNTTAVLCEEYRMPVPDRTADLTLLSTVVHENADIGKLLAEAARLTKDTGAIAIIEWKKQDEEIGPPKEERLGLDELRDQLASYDILEQGDLNNSHYYMLIRKKKI